MPSLRDRIKEILIRDKLIPPDDVEKAILEQKKTGGQLSHILIRLKLIDEKTLTRLLSEGLGLPTLDISRIRIPVETIALIPKDVASKYQVFPISRIGSQLTLAMADPMNIFAVDIVVKPPLPQDPMCPYSWDLLQGIFSLIFVGFLLWALLLLGKIFFNWSISKKKLGLIAIFIAIILLFIRNYFFGVQPIFIPYPFWLAHNDCI